MQVISHQGRAYIVQQEGLPGFLIAGILGWLQQNKNNVGGPLLPYLQEHHCVDLQNQLAQLESEEARIAFLKDNMAFFSVYLHWLQSNGKLK